AQPHFELRQSGVDAALALLDPLLARLRIDGCLRRRGLLGLLLRALVAAREPIGDPLRARHLRERARLLPEDQQQREAVLARKLAAGAAALEGRFAKVHARLVGTGAAALDLAPEGHVVLAQDLPLLRAGKALRGFRGARI